MRFTLFFQFTLLVVGTIPLGFVMGQDDLMAMSLEELLQIKVEGATKTAMHLADVPSAVTVITREDLKALGVEYLDELANLIPGFQSTRGADSVFQYSLSARGRRIANVSAEILVVVDGLRIAEPRSGGVVNAIPRFPLDLVERIEFIRGPGSALYGSNAMLGSIHITTRQKAQQFGFQLGNLDHRSLSLQTHFNERINAQFLLSAEQNSGQTFNVRDSFSTIPLETQDPYARYYFQTVLSSGQTEFYWIQAQTQGEDFYSTETLANDFNRVSTHFRQIAVNQSFQAGSSKIQLAAGWMTNILDLNTQLTAPNALSQISNPPSSDPFQAHANLESEELWLSVESEWLLDPDKLLLGLELRQLETTRATATTNFDLTALIEGTVPIPYYAGFLDITPLNSLGKENVVGLFIQYQKPFKPYLDLTLGLRYDYYEESGGKLSPRIALVHSRQNQSWKLIYGQAFRAPSASERGLLNNPVIVGNQDLEAETVKTLELIWQAQSEHMRFSTSLFRNQYDQAIVQATQAGLRTYLNQDENAAWGSENEWLMEWKPWAVRLGYTHLFENSDSSFREAQRFGHLIVHHSGRRWTESLNLTYQAGRELAIGSDEHRISLNPTWLVHGKILMTWTPNWRLELTMKNLADRDFTTPAQGVRPWLAQGVPNRGREWRIAAIYRP